MAPSYQRMILVCLNDRGEGHPKGSCSRDGGLELLDTLRADLHERGLKGVCRAVGTRCLGQCSKGPVVSVQPDDVWYGSVQASDASDLIDDHVLGGKAVQRLEVPPDELSGVNPEDHPLPPFERPTS